MKFLNYTQITRLMKCFNFLLTLCVTTVHFSKHRKIPNVGLSITAVKIRLNNIVYKVG